jgi:hypothetical protein
MQDADLARGDGAAGEQLPGGGQQAVVQAGQELGLPVVVEAGGLGLVQVRLDLGIGHGAEQVEHRVAEGPDRGQGRAGTVRGPL